MSTDTETSDSKPLRVEPPATKTKAARQSSSSSSIKLSSLSKEPDLEGISEKDKLRRDTLTPIISLFSTSSLMLCLCVVFFAILEHFDPVAGRDNVVDSKVIIALITGLTVQISAIIVAAFKGLFTYK